MFIKVFGGEVKGEEPLALNPDTRIEIFFKPKKGDSPQRAQCGKAATKKHPPQRAQRAQRYKGKRINLDF